MSRFQIHHAMKYPSHKLVLQSLLNLQDHVEHPEGLSQPLKPSDVIGGKKQLLKSIPTVKLRNAAKLVFGICICGDM